MTRNLAYTATTASGLEIDFEFPLHPLTVSGSDVASLLTEVLASLDRRITGSGDISDGDVLQALSMALAVRARMLEAAPGSVHRLSAELVEAALAAPGSQRPLQH